MFVKALSSHSSFLFGIKHKVSDKYSQACLTAIRYSSRDQDKEIEQITGVLLEYQNWCQGKEKCSQGGQRINWSDDILKFGGIAWKTGELEITRRCLGPALHIK